MRSAALILLLLPSLHALRGVHPKTGKLSTVTCVPRDDPSSPARVLPATHVNDNYCDCLHGEDEPGTSACANGVFWCANKAHKPLKLASSRVDDGVCDCCDGSDEPAGMCRDTCGADAARHLSAARTAAQAIRDGAATRAKYVAAGRRSREQDERELRKLERERKQLQKEIDANSEKVDGLRKRKELEDSIPTIPPQRETTSGSGSGDDPENIDDYGDIHDGMEDRIDDDDEFDVNTGKEGRGEEAVDQEPEEGEQRPDTDGDGEGSEDDDEYDDESDLDYDGDDDDDDDDEHEHEEGHGDDSSEDDDLDDDSSDDDDLDDGSDKESEYDKGAETIVTDEQQGFEILDAKPDDGASVSQDDNAQVGTDTSNESEPASDSDSSEVSQLDFDSICAELGSKGSNLVMRRVSYIRAFFIAKLRRMLPKILQGSSAGTTSRINECLKKAEEAKWDLDSKKDKLDERIKKLRSISETDFGPDGALRKLHGTCTKKALGQYEYELCPFDLVRQYEHGSAIAVLGRYEGWEGEVGDHKMAYRGGDHCWNGPGRSIMVELSCGKTEEIISVDEPNRCAYSMKFQTPAVCDEKAADAILAEFQQGHDEGKEEL